MLAMSDINFGWQNLLKTREIIVGAIHELPLRLYDY
jgi:hypothetical protein